MGGRSGDREGYETGTDAGTGYAAERAGSGAMPIGAETAMWPRAQLVMSGQDASQQDGFAAD